MRHFIVFLAFVFVGLSTARIWKNQRESEKGSQPVLRVFGTSSFVSQWGPGPWLKENFERTCGCRVEFFDGADTILLMQRLKSESRTGADVVLGLDQYDLETAEKGFEWQEVDTKSLAFVDDAKPWVGQSPLVPYDYGVLSFVFRKSDLKQLPKSLDDMLAAEYRGQISMEDPRTSSPGLQFLLWLLAMKGEDETFAYLKKFNTQVKAYSTSWSMAYGFFRKKQALSAWSYVTSPVYHVVEEKDSDVIAVELAEGHPIQFEFVGIPSICKQCELAQRFVQLMLSPEGQKVIMEKNYMFPVIQAVKNGTPFATIPSYKTVVTTTIPTASDRERFLKKWSSMRRQE